MKPKKLWLGVVLLATIVTLAMYYLPLPGSGDNYPDALVSKTYGFPLAIRTVETGGIAGVRNESVSWSAGVIDWALVLVVLGAVSYAVRRTTRP